MKKFEATNHKGTCLWCGEKLRHECRIDYDYNNVLRKSSPCCGADVIVRTPEGEDHSYNSGECAQCGHRFNPTKLHRTIVNKTPIFDAPGYMGNGQFCTLRCGYQFGLCCARSGERLVLSKREET